MTALTDLGLSRRVLNVLDANGIATTEQLIALNDRELLGLHRFGCSALDEVRDALDDAGLELAEDPYAPYVCVREGKEARDANLSSFFLCDECATKWQVDAFDGEDAEYVGPRTGGFCINCNVDRSDVRLRQWILCGNCDRVARSIGRSVVADRYVLNRWNAVIRPRAPALTIDSTDRPTLRRGPRGASGGGSYARQCIRRRRGGATRCGHHGIQSWCSSRRDDVLAAVDEETRL